MTRQITLFLTLLCAVVLWPAFASAQSPLAPSSAVYVPPTLKSWVPWIMEKHPDLKCAKRQGSFICQWPGEFSLDVSKERGAFSMVVFVDREQLVCLPGGKQFWPMNVSVDGQKQGVIDQGCAAVSLSPGEHRITGGFMWKQAPEMLHLPLEMGVIELTYMGQKVERPRFEEGKLWIREAGNQESMQKVEDTIRASIYRQVQDGVPMTILTRLELNVSGRAREISLGRVLLDGSTAVSVESQIPVKIQGDQGDVKVYARPGTHQITVTSYFTKNTETIPVPKMTQKFFDPQEIWVWKPNEQVRSVEIDGLLMVDPSRTTLPQAWRGMTTLVAKTGESLKLKTMRRGEVTTAPNQLSLSRRMWLDLDGTGFTVQDKLTGQMRRRWRLDYQKDAGKLGRVRKVKGDEQLLITTAPQTNQDGVELRATSLSVEADIRMEDKRSTVPAVGWDHDVDNLSTELYLPPGWTVLASSGVDQMNGTWLSTWNLFELFVLVLIALSMGKLFGWPWALVAAAAMVLSHGHADAPRYVWFSVIAALALLRVLHERKLWRYLLTSYLLVSCIVLVALFGDYAGEQIRFGVHPQVEKIYGSSNPSSFFMAMDNAETGRPQNTAAAPMAEDEPSQDGDIVQLQEVEKSLIQSRDESENRAISKKIASNVLGGSKAGYGRRSSKWRPQKPAFEQRQIAPNEVVQTGPGVPTWKWRSWRMSWNGPVAKDHQVDLWLLSPTWAFVLRVLSVLALLAMMLVVLMPTRLAFKSRESQFDILKRAKRLLFPALIFSFGAFGAMSALEPATSWARPPMIQSQGITSSDSDVLQELEERLLASQECQGPCLTVPSMTLRAVGANGWEIDATIHAQRDTAWSIPGPAAVLSLQQVTLDGFETKRLRRASNGLLMLRIPAGMHQVKVRAISTAKDVVTLQLDPFAKAKQVTIEASEWSVDGLDEFGRPSASLQLSRKEPTQKGDSDVEKGSQSELPSWYRVERRLLLGMPWQSRTTIFRQKSERPQLIKIPLLKGEAVITEGVRVEDGLALVNLPRGQASVSYLSEINADNEQGAASIVLKAPEGKPWTETWVMECSRIWHCESKGLAPVETMSSQAYKPKWMPWPGEVVEISVARPKATPGSSSTVSAVEYEITPGERRLKASLTMKIRASQGGWQRLKLPEGAEVQNVFIDGAGRNIRPEGRILNLPLKPGTQKVQVKWTQAWERGLWEDFPTVDLGSGAVNAMMRIKHNKDRWLIWSVGPSWGPAVLFWSHMAWLMILALLLSRVSFLPWRTYEWFLLAVGFSQLPILALVPVVLWLFLLSWRQQRAPKSWWKFDLLQLAIVGMTLAFLITLYIAIHSNLILQIDMQVRGMGSSNYLLQWYVDRVDAVLPQAGILSVPMWIWRGVMLVWCLWLVSALFRWFPWAWRAFSQDKFWIASPKRVVPVVDPSQAKQGSRVPPGVQPAVQRQAPTDGTPNGKKAELKQEAPPSEPSEQEGEDPS